MSKAQYIRLKKLAEEIEREAEKAGVDVASSDFDSLLKQALEIRGFTLEQFRQAEAEYEEGADFTILTEKQREALEKKIAEEIALNIGKLVIPTQEQIRDIAEQIARQYVTAPQIINKIVKEVVRETPIIHKETIRELDETKLNEVKTDLQYLQTEYSSFVYALERRIKDVIAKIPTDYISMSVLEPSVREIVAPDLNRILRSLQSQIFRVDKRVTDEAGRGVVSWTETKFSGDDVTTDFVLGATPGSSSLMVWLNGMFQTGAGVDYTLTGATIAFVTAPNLGTNNIVAKYTA